MCTSQLLKRLSVSYTKTFVQLLRTWKTMCFWLKCYHFDNCHSFHPLTEMVLNTLMNAMSLLRRCRVNPALTIQLFSQLFHYISAWLFNQLMGPDTCSLGLRSHYWGATLRQRLTAIEAWAERQGLELAADCHLGHIIQV